MKRTSYKISKQLAEDGFKEKADFYWAKEWRESDPELMHAIQINDHSWREEVPAYDFETILEALPKQHDFFSRGIGKYELRIWYHEGKAFVGYQNYAGFDKVMTFEQEQNESLADTAARLWLELKKKKIF